MKVFSRIACFSVLFFTGFAPLVAKAQSADPQVRSALNLIELGNAEEAASMLTKLCSPKNADAHAALAIADLNLGKVTEAKTEAQVAFDIDRKSPLSRTARALVYGREGNNAEALKEFAQAIKLNDKEIYTYLSLSRFYLSVDSLKPAEINLYRAQQVSDKDVRPYLGLAELYERQRIPDLAIQQYEAAKKLDPNDLTVMAKLAQLYFRTKRYTEAVNEWIKVTKVDSTYAPAYYQVANIYYLAERYPSAVAYAERYVLMRPEDVAGQWLLARALTESGQYTKALPALERVAVNDSLRALSQVLLARSYFYNKEFAKANQIFGSSKVLTPFDLDIYGRSLVLSGDTTGGIAKLRESLVGDTVRKLDSKLETMRQIASFLYAQHRLPESAQMFASIAALKPSLDADVTTGQIFAAAGQFDSAESYYRHAVARDPNSLKARLGFVLMLATRSPESAGSPSMLTETNALIAAAQNSKDTLAQAFGWLGYHYMMAKTPEKSIEPLTNSLKTLEKGTPTWTNSMVMLAQAYHTMGNLKKAKEYYDEILKVDPKNKPAREGVDLIKKSSPGK